MEHNGPGFYYTVRWRRYEHEGKGNFQERSLGPEITKLVIPNQPIYKQYEIYVQSHNQVGEAAMPVKRVIGHSGEGIPIEIPQNFRLNPAKEVTNTSADFLWDAVHVGPWRMKGFFRGYKIQYWKTDVGLSTMREHTIIYQEPDPCGLGERIKREANSGHVYNLWPNTNITANIRALNGKYEGPPSNEVHFTTAEGLPNAISMLRATKVSSQTMQLQWLPPSQPNGNIRSYTISLAEVVRKREQYFQEPIVKHTSSPMIEVTSLKPVTMYRITVWAETEAGKGPPFTIENATLPDVPELPEFKVLSISSSSVNVSWQSRPGLSPQPHYTIKYRPQGEEVWRSLVTLSDPNRNWAIIDNLQPGVYDIRLMASNGHHTKLSHAQPIVMPNRLNKGSVSIRVMYLGDTSVNIKLDDDSDQFHKYFVQYRELGDPNSQWQKTRKVPRERWTYIDKLNAGSKYLMQVIGISRNGETLQLERQVVAGDNQASEALKGNSAMSSCVLNYLSLLLLLCLSVWFVNFQHVQS